MRFDLIAVLLVIAALASYANYRVLRLPATIGLTLISLVLSLLVVAAGHLQWIDAQAVVSAVGTLDFSGVLLHGMLAYLLFAGALHVDLSELRSEALPVAILATIGVFVTTGVVGTLTWGLAQLLGIELPFIYALVFGALIAPTDPIAVLGILKQVKAPHSLQVRLSGESLFNDGVGVALFLTIVGVATSGTEPDFGHAALLLLIEAAGGIALGFVCGWTVYKLLSGVDEYPVEILLTIALAAGVYALAEAIHVSAPIAVVVAGLLIGNHGRASAMSDKTREHLDTFWELIDEILNAVLFVLIGLEVLLLRLGDIEQRVCLARRRGDRGRSDRACSGRVAAGRRAAPAFPARQHRRADVGGVARRHLDRARPVAAGDAVSLSDRGVHLRRRGVLDRRAGTHTGAPAETAGCATGLVAHQRGFETTGSLMNVFDDWTGLLRVLTVGCAAYVALILFLRISGKRTLSKLNAFDLVVTVALGSTFATVLVSKDVPLLEGLLAFAVLIGAQYVIAALCVRFPMAGRLIKSDPRLLVCHGRLLDQAMREERVTVDEIRSIVRGCGYVTLEEVGAVVLETDGSFHVLPFTDSSHPSALEGVSGYTGGREG